MAELDVDRKVRQLDNDVREIYEILERICDTQQEHGSALGRTDAKVDRLEAKTDRLEVKADRLEVKVDRLEATAGGLAGSVERLEATAGATDAKVDRLGANLDRVLDRLGLLTAADDD
jgi:chromosome segregation ATPase